MGFAIQMKCLLLSSLNLMGVILTPAIMTVAQILWLSLLHYYSHKLGISPISYLAIYYISQDLHQIVIASCLQATLGTHP